MVRTLISELPSHVGEQVTIRGWAQVVRDQKRVQFVVVRDESGLAQAVLGKDDPPTELNEQITSLSVESAVTLTGTVVADERVKLGGRHGPGHGHGRLRGQRRELVVELARWVVLSEHDLGETRFVTHHDELNALLIAHGIDPAANRHLLADLRRKIGYQRAPHAADPI